MWYNICRFEVEKMKNEGYIEFAKWLNKDDSKLEIDKLHKKIQILEEKLKNVCVENYIKNAKCINSKKTCKTSCPWS